MSEPVRYSGRVYVRPIGRGVTLLDLPGKPHLEDLLPEGYGYLDVEFVLSEGDNLKHFEDAWDEPADSNSADGGDDV